MNSTIFIHRGKKKKPQESQDRRTKLGNRCYLMSRQCVAEVMKVVGYQGKKDKSIDGAEQKGQKCIMLIRSAEKEQKQCNAESSRKGPGTTRQLHPQYHTLFT